MDIYVRMVDDMKRAPDDNPTVGIILCTQKDASVVRYSVLHRTSRTLECRACCTQGLFARQRVTPRLPATTALRQPRFRAFSTLSRSKTSSRWLPPMSGLPFKLPKR